MAHAVVNISKTKTYHKQTVSENQQVGIATDITKKLAYFAHAICSLVISMWKVKYYK